MIEPDYEALGRYTGGLDTLKQLLQNREGLLKRLDGLIEAARSGDRLGCIARFNVTQAQDTLNCLAELETNLTATISNVNINAAKCGKIPVR